MCVREREREMKRDCRPKYESIYLKRISESLNHSWVTLELVLVTKKENKEECLTMETNVAQRKEAVEENVQEMKSRD